MTRFTLGALSLCAFSSLLPAQLDPVTAKGEVRAARSGVVRSALPGQGTIIWLAPEGSTVKEGDRVARLDASAVAERRAEQRVAVARAEAGVESASHEVGLVQLSTREAELEAEMAARGAEVALLEARRELARARARGSSGEAEKAARAAEIEAAESKIALADVKRELAKVRGERQRFEGRRGLEKARAVVAAKRAVLDVARERLTQLDKALKSTLLLAPIAGTVVYAAGRVPIEEGVSVRERQTLLNVVDMSKMVVSARVAERDIKGVRVGAAVTVRADALVDVALQGRVTRVARRPAATRLAPDRGRFYQVLVELTGAAGDRLRPGMSAEVRIER